MRYILQRFNGQVSVRPIHGGIYVPGPVEGETFNLVEAMGLIEAARSMLRFRMLKYQDQKPLAPPPLPLTSPAKVAPFIRLSRKRPCRRSR